MVYIFVLLFLISLILLPIVVIRPQLIFRRDIGRKKAGAIMAGLAALFLVLTGVTAPPAKGRVASTMVTPAPVVSPVPTASPTSSLPPTPAAKHNGTLVKVINVVDGDTIKIATGQTVRYIGIDTPETVHPDKPVMCYGKEAAAKNTELVEGKVVELEKDVSETDKYGRLLRYVWLEDELVNEFLVREGYAQSSSYPPDVKYQSRFVSAQRLARSEEKGLWSRACAVSPTVGPTIKSETKAPPPTSGSEAGGSGYVCDCTKACTRMSSCAEAQYQLTVCGCAERDRDGDGVACDSDCQ